MKNHSTISRRDFMKAIGLGTATLATAGVVANDLDEILALGSDIDKSRKHRWWVKEKDEPTVEVDWGMQKRADGRLTGQCTYWQIYYYGADEIARRSAEGSAYSANARATKQAGFRLRDGSLSSASTAASSRVGGGSAGTTWGFIQKPSGNLNFNTYGYKHEDTPENNSRMIRNVLRIFGAGDVGFGMLDQQMKEKFVLTHAKMGANSSTIWEPPLTVAKAIEFDNSATLGYETDTHLMLPGATQLYDAAFTMPMVKQGFRAGGQFQSFSNGSRYRNMDYLQLQMQYFIAHIGWNMYGYPTDKGGLVPSQGTGMMTGICENGRNSGYSITPEFGTINGFFSLVTDLPLASTRPIDAGIWRFCHTCKKCAEICPFDCIPNDSETIWEPKINGQIDYTHNPGRKQFWQNGPQCWTMMSTIGGCGMCMGACTFNTDGATVHDVVRATLSTTSLFNGFLWRADKFFGYGMYEDPEKFWEINYPTYGFASNFGNVDGRYRK